MYLAFLFLTKTSYLWLLSKNESDKMMHYYFLFFFFLISHITSAQSPYFKHFTVENNLPSSECYQVLQDKKGYIWIATDKGVARYNGYQFQTFTKEDGLPENCIIRMHEDHEGRIWFGGVSNQIAYFENNKITSLKINKEIAKNSNFGYINSMAFCDNTLWIGMYGTSNIYKIVFSKGITSTKHSKRMNPLKH